jgi:hypothetical protein
VIQIMNLSDGVLLNPTTGRPLLEESREAYAEALARMPNYVRVNLEKAKQHRGFYASRQYFADVLADPPSASLAAVTAAAETGLWSVPLYTPVPALDARAGKIYQVTAGGLLSSAATPGTITITPRWGTTTGGNSLGASQALTMTASITSQPWFMQFTLVFRQVGAAASTSTCVGTGFMKWQTTSGASQQLVFGGTVVTTADTTTAQGIFIGNTFSLTTANNTPLFVYIQSLN